jgi:hypothetical protein
MLQSRRRILSSLVSAAGVLVAKPVLLSGLSPQHATPQPLPSPNAPNQNFPPGLDGPDNPPALGNKAVDPRKQQEIREDVQKLFELASELREQTAKSDLNSMLPVSMVKKAQQIEKLAKHIKDLSKG